MITSFDNNEDNVCLLLKDNVDKLRVRSHARSHNPEFREHGVIITFFFGVSSNKQFNCLKS